VGASADDQGMRRAVILLTLLVGFAVAPTGAAAVTA
jgi:hypothetical protein